MRQYIRNFIQHETFGGFCLILATALALICANSPWLSHYNDLLALPLRMGISAGEHFFGLEKPVSLWVNDGLMTLFFLLVGLEIKRELVMGELSSREKALRPVLAAIGGMVVPIAIFMCVNNNSPETMKGWAIPCATDIAFALGVLTLVGSRVPTSIKILLTAIAIVDDLLAILIIAIFYTEGVEWTYLVVASFGMLALAMLNAFNVARISLYVIVGALIWYCFLKAGLHPTLAGVVTAMAIPLEVEDKGVSRSPLMRMEHGLHDWIVFFVVPIFAFANAGLSFKGVELKALWEPLSLGIILGLVVGKPVGIMGGLYLGHILKWTRKPSDVMWRHYACVSVLCGIGFTVALFIGKLAFDAPVYIEEFKLGILFASLVMAVLGFFLCRLSFSKPLLTEQPQRF